MSEEKKLSAEELEQVSGGTYNRSDYEDLIGENEDEYWCKVCGKKYDKEYCYWVDVRMHLKNQHGIDRAVPSTIPNPIRPTSK